MKRKVQFISTLLILVLLLTGCFGTGQPTGGTTGTSGTNSTSVTKPNSTRPNNPSQNPSEDGDTTEDTSMGRDETSYGESLDSLGVWDGYFENGKNDVTITCLTGSANRYRIEGDVITFNPMAAESVYTIEGKWKGSIVINTGDDYKFTLEMHGFTLIADSTNPILVQSGDEVSITAKKGYDNYIYDMRLAIDETDATLHSAAVYSTVDLEIAGKGNLTVLSENNNGIGTKDDLQVKNLTLTVVCRDNALKGNDSVEILGADLTLIATAGDGIKTTSSDVSSKGNQRGTVSITDSLVEIYAAADGIDAAYNVTVDGATSVVDIYTHRYSNYSDLPDAPALDRDAFYIAIPSDAYFFSVKYYNSDTDFVWENASHHSAEANGVTRVHYYTAPLKNGYAQLQIFIYASEADLGQDASCLYATDLIAPHASYDTYGFEPIGSSFDGGWVTRDIASGSSKGIKAANEITLNSGNITVKSYDDAIHANNDTVLENGQTPLGNVTVKGATVTLYTKDDALHADGAVAVKGGSVKILHSYEGIEGFTVSVSNGSLSVVALDDGINATAQTGSAITVSGGSVYVYCKGDGMDSNSKTSGGGITFSGGTTVIITTSGGNSAIDTEKGYAYTGGKVLALMPSGGMTHESVNCSNFSSVGTSSVFSAKEGATVCVTVGGEEVMSVTLPCDLSGTAVYLGANNAEIAA